MTRFVATRLTRRCVAGARRLVAPGDPQVHHEALQRRQGREDRQQPPEARAARRSEEQLAEAEQGSGRVRLVPPRREEKGRKEAQGQEAQSQGEDRPPSSARPTSTENGTVNLAAKF